MMKTQKHGFYDMRIVARTVVFIVFLTGIMILSAQEIRADPESFRSRYQLGQHDLLVSLPNIAPLAYEENGVKKGSLVELVAAMDRIYQTQGVEIAGTLKKGRIILTGIYPFKRSIEYVADGYTDFHIPYLVNPHTSIEYLERELGITYSSVIHQYGNFPLYATKEFASLLPEFEQQIGKKVSQLSSREDFKHFDEFLQQHNITIEVDRAHTHFYPFTTEPSSHSIFSLKKLVARRIDGYIHNMQECDMELRVNKLDTTNIEKIEFMKIVSRMIVSATEKGKETDEIISRLAWKLQGRDASEVPRADFPHSGTQKEVPYNAYHESEAFKKSEWFSIIGPTRWNPPFTKEFE
jgi:hypothetical protein